jgi:sRNA-binding regulator protein Hfq
VGYLLGLQEYLDEAYHVSVFDQARDSGYLWEMHLHGHQIMKARVIENLPYDLKLNIQGQGEKEIPKIEVKFLYPVDVSESVRILIKIENDTKKRALKPILAPKDRYFIKNKSLFPLMKEKRVVFFTLLEGEVIRGIITGFSRYDIMVHLKGGIPVTILRHSIYDLRDKKGRCFLKSVQTHLRDWEKSDLYING